MRFQVMGLQFGPDGEVIVDYTDTGEDQRANGMMRNHQMFVPHHVPELADQVQEVVDAVEELMKAAVSQFVLSGPMPLVAIEVDDDEPGPFDNPLERDLT